MKEKKAKMIGDSRGKFQPISTIVHYNVRTDEICKKSYNLLIEVTLMANLH